jgi:predicted nucleic-acid-binding protein
MTALDTNVIVRVVTRDDPEQLQAALAVMREGPVRVSKTVLLETEWVLRYCYKLDRSAIGETLRKLLGYPKLEVENRSQVIQALFWYAEGLDFADALHLASCGRAARFATFDRELARAASCFEEGPAVHLLS